MRLPGPCGEKGRLIVAASVVATLVAATALMSCRLPGNQFVVNTATDAPDDAPGDGVCEATAGMGDCTLRAAVMEANHERGTNDIELGDGNTFPLTVPRTADTEADGDLDITETVSINGHSTIAPTTDADRAIDIIAGTALVDGVTIQNGHDNQGGAIQVQAGAGLQLSNATLQHDTATFLGGAIYSEGATTITNSRLLDNVATGQFFGDVAIPGFGGAILAAAGTMTVVGSTITDNTSNGAVIETRGQAALQVDRSTFVDNGAIAAAGAVRVIVHESTFSHMQRPVFQGGGIDITASTVADALAPIFDSATTATVRGSILDTRSGACATVATDENPAAHPAAQVTSGGYNLVSDSTCHLAGPGDQQSTKALLGMLNDNGGPTHTHRPLANSPALDAIPFPTPGLCETGDADQAGEARPVHSRCDVGAIEGGAIGAATPLHLVVTNRDDSPDSTPGNGVCDGGPGGCSLRAAVEEANAWPTADEITLGPGPFVYDVTGDLQVDDDLSIHGGGNTIEVSQTSDAFESRFGSLELDDLTVDESAFPSVLYLVQVSGALRLVDVNLVGGGGSVGIRGVVSPDAISSTVASVVLQSSTISGNGSSFALWLDGRLSMRNSTIAGNPVGGSAIFLNQPLAGGPVTSTIDASTIVGNARSGADGVAAVDSTSTVVIAGSIIDHPTGASAVACGNQVVSAGFNLIGDASCNATAPGDQQNVAPVLGLLGNNGGPTPTRLPVAGSAAVDRIPAGTAGLCVAGSVDQRGVARPVGSACDKGAVEGTTAVP